MHTRITVLLAFICAVSAVALQSSALHAQSPQSYNTTAYDSLNPTSSGGRYSAIWGYTDPTGREYALVGAYNGLEIIDITERPIRLVTTIAGPHNGWREIKTYGTRAYVVSEGGAGLQIVDLSELPDTARLIKSDTSFFRTGHTISQEGHYLYVNGTKADAAANGGVVILDLEPDPSSPRRIGKYTNRYIHDVVVYNDTMYASAINDGQLDIVYIGNRTAPKQVATITYPFAGTHNSDLTADHRYLMTTDEINSTPKTLKIWDLADRGNITKVVDYTPVPGEIVHNVHRKDNLAFVAWYSAGTRIIDMSNPEEPAELGYFDTSPQKVNNYVGNWGTYPYFQSGKIISSDIQGGLYVFTFNGSVRGRVHGVVRNSVTNLPIPGATIYLKKLGRTITANAKGEYFYAAALDTFDFTASAVDYFDGNGRIEMSPAAAAGELGAVRDIVLVPMPIARMTIRAFDSMTGVEIAGVSYALRERNEEFGNSPTPLLLKLPKDSVYSVMIGAWGYRPLKITISGIDGDYRVKLNRGYIDNAELDLGWSRAAYSDDATSGNWERGEPQQTEIPGKIVQPGWQTTPGGNEAFFTGLANSNDNGAGSNDIDGGTVTLTTPLMKLADSTDPYINFKVWYSRNGNATAIDDTLEMWISNDDADNWTRIDTMTTSPQQWEARGYRLKDFLSITDKMRFKLVASDLHGQSLVEAGLDDFVVTNGGPGDIIQDSANVVLPPSSVSDEAQSSAIARLIVLPNPIVGTGALLLHLAAPQHAMRLELFDLLGRRVAVLHEGVVSAGEHRYSLDAATLGTGSLHWRLTLDNGERLTGSVVVVQ